MVRVTPSDRRVFVGLVLLLVAAGAALHAQRRFDPREIQATYLFNFAQFVDWPAASFADARAPIVIGVLGEDPFGGVLDAVVEGELVNGRALTVARFGQVQDVTACHILFVSASEAPRHADLLAALRGRPIVTVGDTPEFTKIGGMIRFVTDRNRIRLEINLGAARSAGVTLSSRLLRVASIVGAEGSR